VIAPLLEDVGGVIVGAFEPYTTVPELSMKPVKVGVDAKLSTL
jgi:hypothetical protein